MTKNAGKAPDESRPPGQPCSWNLIWAVTAAAAMVARADGHVHPAERLQLISYLRRSEMHGLRASFAMRLFDECVQEMERSPAGERRDVLSVLADLAGTPWAWIVLRAAEHVASADNELHAAEVRAIDAIRTALDLPPGVPERYPACVIRGGRA